MRYRKLRIARSVAWGVVVVLLCVLWVRSICTVDRILRINGSNRYASVSISGQGALYFENTFDPSGGSQRQPPKLAPQWVYQRDEAQGNATISFSWKSGQNWWMLQIPFWFLVGACGALGAVPWLRFRYSLRTLLFATTLVAVGLGLIMYVSR
jgi:hypothetical protein